MALARACGINFWTSSYPIASAAGSPARRFHGSRPLDRTLLPTNRSPASFRISAWLATFVRRYWGALQSYRLVDDAHPGDYSFSRLWDRNCARDPIHLAANYAPLEKEPNQRIMRLW